MISNSANKPIRPAVICDFAITNRVIKAKYTVEFSFLRLATVQSRQNTLLNLAF